MVAQSQVTLVQGRLRLEPWIQGCSFGNTGFGEKEREGEVAREMERGRRCERWWQVARTGVGGDRGGAMAAQSRVVCSVVESRENKGKINKKERGKRGEKQMAEQNLAAKSSILSYLRPPQFLLICSLDQLLYCHLLVPFLGFTLMIDLTQ